MSVCQWYISAYIPAQHNTQRQPDQHKHGKTDRRNAASVTDCNLWKGYEQKKIQDTESHCDNGDSWLQTTAVIQTLCL